MKKVWILAAVLALLCMLLAAGQAEEAPDLMDVYLAGAKGDQWIATAVPVYAGVALTAPLKELEDPSRIYLTDGKRRWSAGAVIPVSEGALNVIFFGEDGEEMPPAFEAQDTDDKPQLNGSIVRSGDALRSRINRAVTDVSLITWKGREAWLLTLSGDTQPGALLLNPDGLLEGIVAAEYAEGDCRYVALTSRGLYNSFAEAAAFLELVQHHNPAEGFTVTVKDNEVTFDWSGMALPEAQEGQHLYLIVADAASDYLTFYEPAPGETQRMMLLTPGRSYLSGMTVCANKPGSLPEQTALTILPPAELLTEYGFRPEKTAIAEIPEGGLEEGGMPVPVTEVTEELLRSGRACFYSLSSYEVDRKIDYVSLLVTLTDPNGSNYRYESAWAYDPAYMAHDEWFVTLDDTGLLEMLNSTGYPEGVYQVCMYIGGKLADGFTFVLK